jgi:RimJ/RimL family protein N-acetyltransferase
MTRTRLTTARLIVRPWTTDEADVADFFAIYGDEEVSRYLFSDHRLTSPDAARDALRAVVAREEPESETGAWAVIERATGRAIGTAIFKRVTLNGSEDIEIGFHFGRQAWGQGFATELARGLIEDGFARLGLTRIVGFAKTDNAASIRVLEKAGMRYEGTSEFRNQPVVLYAIEREGKTE